MGLHPCELTQGKFPHRVQHKISYGGSEWVLMCNWLDTHVGPMAETWTWMVSDLILFAHEDHAIKFNLAWS